MARPSGDFLAAATPAAGKTTFGLRVAHGLLRAGVVSRVAIVGPTAHICRQWASAAARAGARPRPQPGQRRRPRALGPARHRRHLPGGRRRPDGPPPRDQLAPDTSARRRAPPHGRRGRLGTQRGARLRPRDAAAAALRHTVPVRQQRDPVRPLRRRRHQPLRLRLRLHRRPGRRRLPADHLPAPTTARWSGPRRQGLAAPTSTWCCPQAESARRLRTALDADGDWIAQVLRDADAKLTDVRAAGPRRRRRPGGRRRQGRTPRSSRTRLARDRRRAARGRDIATIPRPPRASMPSRAAATRWLVSVLMVSEGVDIPRLRVGVYATAARTELFFRQVVGPLRPPDPPPGAPDELPAAARRPALKALAAKVEEERRHALELTPRLEEAFAGADRARRVRYRLPRALLQRPSRGRHPLDHPARRRARAVRRRRPSGVRNAIGTAGPAELVADGSDHGGSEPEPPAYVLRERARDDPPRPRPRPRPPHRRVPRRGPRVDQPLQRRLGRRRDARAAGQGQRPGSSACWPRRRRGDATRKVTDTLLRGGLRQRVGCGQVVGPVVGAQALRDERSGGAPEHGGVGRERPSARPR